MQSTRFIQLLLQPNLAPNYASQSAWTVLRIVVGIMMIHNGLDKLSNIESFADAYVRVIGLPFPIFFSYVAAFTELIGAPLLALGLMTRPAALGLFSTMLVAMYHHIKVAGFSIPYLELSAIYAACFLFFLVNGAGLFSIDAIAAGWMSALLANQPRTAMTSSLSKQEEAIAEKVSQ
ncbi:MAG TPA: DoxX family protein [Synechococcales cyanobacterium M55_K2018_004]|nr:DoxX family protein [Synechococcales cyanobacterium M55_K2018_004]